MPYPVAILYLICLVMAGVIFYIERQNQSFAQCIIELAKAIEALKDEASQLDEKVQTTAGRQLQALRALNSEVQENRDTLRNFSKELLHQLSRVEPKTEIPPETTN